MSSNLGMITYGDLLVLPGYDTASSGFGNLTVSGTSLLSGSTTSILGTLGVTGATTMTSSLTVNGASTFNNTVTFSQASTFTSDTTITATSDSTGTTDGAFQVKGGMSVVKSFYLGGILNTAGAITAQSTLSVTGSTTQIGVLSVTNTTESTIASNGALVVSGGLGVVKSLRVGSGKLYLAEHLVLQNLNDKTYLNSPSGTLQINDAGQYDVFVNTGSQANFNVAGATVTSTSGLGILVTVESSSSSTGSLRVAGGAGIQKNLYVGGDIVGGIAKSITFGSGLLLATTQSTSSANGALQVAGGAGIAKNLYVGGFIDTAATSASTSYLGSLGFQTDSLSANWIRSLDTSRTSAWTSLKFGSGATSILSINATNLTIDATTASTSSSTGSLVVAGGAGITGNLFVQGTSNFTGITKFTEDVWLSGKKLYLNAHNSQTDGLVFSDVASAGGPLLFGSLGGALATTSGGSKIALNWNIDSTVSVHGTTETTSTSTGSFLVAGGAGISKSLSVGASFLLQGSSFNVDNNNLMINANASTIYLRNTAGSDTGEFESSTLFFNFKTTTTPFVTFQVDKTSGHVKVLQTDNSTAANTGALQVSGGASISKNLWVQGNQEVFGDLTVNGNITSGNGPVAFSSTVDSTSTSTGSVTIAGGMGLAKNFYMGGLAVMINTTDSTSISSGTLTVSGGVGIAKKLFVGSDSTFEAALLVKGNTTMQGIVSITNTTVTTSSSTGSLVLSGGLGVTGGMYMNGVVNLQNTSISTSVGTGALQVAGGVGITGNLYTSGLIRFTNTTPSTSNTTGSLVLSGGLGVAGEVFVGGNFTIQGTSTFVGAVGIQGVLTVTATADSTGSNTGSLIVSGGLGVQKALYVGSTLQSVSSTSGSLVVSGGLAVAKDFFTAGNFTFDGTNPLLTFAGGSGLAAPSFTTRSAGTRILLASAITTSTVDFAIGTDVNSSWFSLPSNTSTHSLKWYGGTTVAMTLDGTGHLAINGTVDATSSTNGTFTVSGGVGVAKSMYVGGAININSTAFINGTITANSNYTGAGTLAITNVTNSSTIANGSIVTAGGVGVALDIHIGGSSFTSGNNTITGFSTVAGLVSFTNTTESTATGNGALIVHGGTGIEKNLNVGGNFVVSGNTTINGDLYVSGTRTVVNTSVTTTKDNVLLVNSGPSGTAYAGIGMKRYQLANNDSIGDVVNNDVPEFSGTCSGTGTTTAIVLSPGANSNDDHYNSYWVFIHTGTGSGQARKIKSYIGATRTATIFSTSEQSVDITPVEGLDFNTVPNNTSQFKLYNSQFIVTIYDETNAEYNIGATPEDPTNNPTVPIRKEITVHTGKLILDDQIIVDTINDKNGNGIIIENVHIKNGDIDSVVSINGNLVDVTSTVTLVDNTLLGTAVLPGTNTYGAYQVLVMDSVHSGAAATFFLSGNTTRGGSVTRVTSTTGANNEHLTVSWSQGDFPRLRFLALPNNSTGANVNYKVLISRVVL